MGAFDPPQGDSGSLQAAARSYGTVAGDLYNQVSSVRSAMQLALSEWRAPRADDFRHAALAMVDEVAMASSAAATAARILSDYATALQTAIDDVATYKRLYDAEDAAAKPHDPDEVSLKRARLMSNYIQQALNAKIDLQTTAGKVAAALDGETDLVVPNSAHLSPAEIARKVDSATGLSTAFDAVTYNLANTETLWNVVLAAQGAVFAGTAPKPGDPGFQTWFAGLTAVQQELEMQKLSVSFPPPDFNPYSTVQPGAMPEWANQFNLTHAPYCSANGPLGAPGYGYFGGGTILGPGGTQWPIVMPYYSDGKHVYMADDGQSRTDGGIEQLDGTDPGWRTVSTYTGLGQFGSISTGTKLAAAFLIGTGQELETTQTDPEAVRVGPDGQAYAGDDVKEIPQSPPDKAFWDLDSETMMPKPMEGLPPGAIQPNLEYNEAALGAASLLTQGAMAATAVHNIDSHASRQWYVSYQVNDDGRTRAIVHTYSAGPTEDDKTYVGSFANTFPTGQQGNTSEVPYNTRYNQYTSPVFLPAPDEGVEYSGRGEPIDNANPIQEKLNK